MPANQGGPADQGRIAAHAAPDRDEGDGPYRRLILRNLTIVDGTGGPAYGPADLVVEGNRIAQIFLVGPPTGPRLQPPERPQPGPDGHELDLSGCFALPGLIDAHAHLGWPGKIPNARYAYDLWLGHGITTIREPGCFVNGLDFVVSESRRSDANEIAAPRIVAFVGFGQDRQSAFTEASDARDWVGEVAERGAAGVKFWGYRPDILEASLHETTALGLGSACHNQQSFVGRANALDLARWGLGSVEHWYGLPEAMFVDRRLQAYSPDYNYENEFLRFADAGTLWQQAAEPGSRRWDEVIEELIGHGVTLDPTFNVYIGLRDAERVQTSYWHGDYTVNQLWEYWQPDSGSHGSFFSDWGTEQELAWKKNFRRWMAFVADYFNRGGRVTVGSDCGSIFKLYGFGVPEEMELLREAGLRPLEIIRAATLHAAELLGVEDRLGSIEAGKVADLAIVDGNPLANLKVLYGHGQMALAADGTLERRGGVRLTIKDGVVYPVDRLLARVRELVAEERERSGDLRRPPRRVVGTHHGCAGGGGHGGPG